MKNTLFYIGIVLAAIGCTKDLDVASSGDNVLTITSNVTTRVTGTNWDTNDAIGVYMTSTSLGDEGENVEYTTIKGDGTFTSSTPIYYPESGTVDIRAYYPYVNGVDFEAYEIKSDKQVDLLSAKKTGVSPSPTAVDLEFDHLLSNISLTIKPGYELTEAKLKNLVVKLSGISTEATYNLTDNSVTTSNTDQKLTLTTQPWVLHRAQSLSLKLLAVLSSTLLPRMMVLSSPLSQQQRS